MKEQDLGVAVLNGREVLCHFDEGTNSITLFSISQPLMIPKEVNTIICQGVGRINDCSLYQLAVPLKADQGFFTKLVRDVDYRITGFVPGCKYTGITFEFPELNYIVPTGQSARICQSEIVLDRQVTIACRFDGLHWGQPVEMFFQHGCSCQCNSPSGKITAETKAEFRIDFEETDDIRFIESIYHSARAFFAFICNRQNIALRSGRLITAHKKQWKQEIRFSDRYLKPTEEDSGTRIPSLALLKPHIQELYQMFQENACDDGCSVSIGAVHASNKERNLIDIKQSLSIISAFERYVRELLPPIFSKTTQQFYDDLKAWLDQYIQATHGRLKEKAKGFRKSLKPNISLSEMIRKCFNGYNGWPSLKSALGKCFDSDVEQLAQIANEWRNELAHNKGEFDPDERVIDAVRFIELLDYALILRHAHYTDQQIAAILEKIFS